MCDECINSEEDNRWILCPVCGNKTRTKIRRDTELIHFPLYCPKCRRETLVNVKDMIVTVEQLSKTIGEHL